MRNLANQEKNFCPGRDVGKQGLILSLFMMTRSLFMIPSLFVRIILIAIFLFPKPAFSQTQVDSSPVSAQEGTRASGKGGLFLEIKDNLITLRADEVSVTEVLKKLGEKTGMKVKVLEGVKDNKVTLDMKGNPLERITVLFQKLGINYLYGYEEKPGNQVLYVLPEAGKEVALTEEGKAALALTLRNGKIYKEKRVGKKFLVLKESSEEHERYEKVEFYDDKGKLVRVRDVFPKEAKGRGFTGVAPSPNREYLAVMNSYSILNKNGEEEWHDSVCFYNSKGELQWQEIPRQEDMESRFERTYRYPRNNGTILEILPFQAEVTQRGKKGEITKKTQLETWTGIPSSDEEPPIQFGINVDESSPYIALTRIDGLDIRSPRRYEVYLINGDSGEVLWRREKNGINGVVENLFTQQDVLVIREIIPEVGREISTYFQIYDLEGNDLWRIKVDPNAEIYSEDYNTLKIVYSELISEHSIGRLIMTHWKLVESKTGSIIKEGRAE